MHVHSVRPHFGVWSGGYKPTEGVFMTFESADLEAWRLVLISGSGRSGSTLLHRLLGQYPDATEVGEAVRVWECTFERDELCGCGAMLTGCRFWIPVLDRIGVSQAQDAQQVVELRQKSLRWVEVARLMLRRPSEHAAEYARVLEQLFTAAANESATSIVVDSSKQPVYTAFLVAALGKRVSLIHLVRDPRAVAFSLQRRVRRPDVTRREEYMPTYSAVRGALAWLRRNLQAELVAAMATRSTRLQYEGLLENPGDALTKLRTALELPEIEPTFVSDHTAELVAGHGVAGNPRRFEQGSVALKNDDEWLTGLSVAARRQVEFVTFPLRARYGYSSQRSGSDARSRIS